MRDVDGCESVRLQDGLIDNDESDSVAVRDIRDLLGGAALLDALDV